MKKLGLLTMVLVCGLLLFSGCGKKNSLVCEASLDSMLAGYGEGHAVVEAGFDKEDILKDLGLTFELKITSDLISASDMGSLKLQLESTCNAQGSQYDSCKVTLKDKTLTLKASGSAKEDSAKRTKKEFREVMEEQGMPFGNQSIRFSCK